MINHRTTTDPLCQLDSSIRAAHLRVWRRLGWALLLALAAAMLTACGGGDPEDEERPCIVDGKPYKPEVCR